MTGTIERAYELARSGNYATVTAIREALNRAGCDAVNAHLSGLGLKRELQRMIKVARSGAPALQDSPSASPPITV